MLLLDWLGIWVVYGIGNFAFNSSKAMLERTACEVVIRISIINSYANTHSNENVTLTESEGNSTMDLLRLVMGQLKILP
jgi:hypothetical protein